MAEGPGELELYNQWFQIADVDRDGMLSGAEAVQFFMRSGLPQNPTLFRIWQFVAGDRPALNRQEFYTAMKLVSSAQANGGVLDDQQAMRTINGLSGPTPPPRMAGLELPATMAAPAAAAPAPPARAAPAPPPGAFSGPTYPPLTPDKASSYQTAFEQLDGDRDGLVQGVDCFPALMRSGLSKDVLKSIWDVVAGDVGHLNRHQFIQCLYLVDCAKTGIPVPATLPPGQFPPTQGGIGLQSMVGHTQQSDIYTAGQLGVDPLLPRATYIPGTAPAVAFQSQVPPAPTAAQAAGLSAAESARLQSERDEALRQEAERKRAEEERVAAAARREFYTQSLAALRVAQGKVARTLVEAQQRLEMERAEAESMENQYSTAYEAFSTQHARAAPLLEALKRVEDEKTELTAKMAALQTAVEQLEGADPEFEARGAAECEALKKEITALTVRHEALQAERAASTAQKEGLEAAVAAVRGAGERASAGVDALAAEVAALDATAKADGAKVVDLLKRVAPLYNELYAAAKAALVPLPPEALATIARPAATAFKYDPLRFGSAAADWDVFADEGFTITAAVAPDTRLLSLTSTSLTAAEAEAEDGGAAADAAAGGDAEEKEGDAEAVDPPAEDDAVEKEGEERESGETVAAATEEAEAAADAPEEPVTEVQEAAGDESPAAAAEDAAPGAAAEEEAPAPAAPEESAGDAAKLAALSLNDAVDLLGDAATNGDAPTAAASPAAAAAAPDAPSLL